MDQSYRQSVVPGALLAGLVLMVCMRAHAQKIEQCIADQLSSLGNRVIGSHRALTVSGVEVAKSEPLNSNALVGTMPEDASEVLRGTSRILEQAHIAHKVVTFAGYRVVELLESVAPSSETWVKMQAALRGSHQVPTYISEDVLKAYKFDGGLVKHGTGKAIVLDQKLSPTDKMLVLHHEAVHSTTDHRIIHGSESRDAALGMTFMSNSPSLMLDLPSGYKNGFQLDEIKAYSKSSRLAFQIAKKQQKDEKDLIRDYFKKGQKFKNDALKFIHVSNRLLNLIEEHLQDPVKRSLINEGVSYYRKGVPDVFKFRMQILTTDGRSLVVDIPFRDVEAVQTGKLENVDSKLLSKIRDAKSLIREYEISLTSARYRRMSSNTKSILFRKKSTSKVNKVNDEN